MNVLRRLTKSGQNSKKDQHLSNQSTQAHGPSDISGSNQISSGNNADSSCMGRGVGGGNVASQISFNKDAMLSRDLSLVNQSYG